MKKYLFILLFIPFLYGCPEPIKVIVDLGSLADSVLLMVPYQNGEVCQLRHSNGHLINFTVERATINSSSSFDPDLVGYSDTAKIYKFQENITTLTPDYPIFNIRFQISYISNSLNIGNEYFGLLSNDSCYNADNYSDSLIVGTKLFYKVMKLKTDYPSSEFPLVDSLYYNKSIGIIKIKLSNGESYTTTK